MRTHSVGDDKFIVTNSRKKVTEIKLSTMSKNYVRNDSKLAPLFLVNFSCNFLSTTVYSKARVCVCVASFMRSKSFWAAFTSIRWIRWISFDKADPIHIVDIGTNITWHLYNRIFATGDSQNQFGVGHLLKLQLYLASESIIYWKYRNIYFLLLCELY